MRTVDMRGSSKKIMQQVFFKILYPTYCNITGFLYVSFSKFFQYVHVFNFCDFHVAAAMLISGEPNNFA